MIWSRIGSKKPAKQAEKHIIKNLEKMAAPSCIFGMKNKCEDAARIGKAMTDFKNKKRPKPYEKSADKQHIVLHHLGDYFCKRNVLLEKNKGRSANEYIYCNND